jgi:hypothetical protein
MNCLSEEYKFSVVVTYKDGMVRELSPFELHHTSRHPVDRSRFISADISHIVQSDYMTTQHKHWLLDDVFNHIKGKIACKGRIIIPQWIYALK